MLQRFFVGFGSRQLLCGVPHACGEEVSAPVHTTTGMPGLGDTELLPSQVLLMYMKHKPVDGGWSSILGIILLSLPFKVLAHIFLLPSFHTCRGALLGGYGCSKRDYQIGLRHHLAHVSLFFPL